MFAEQVQGLVGQGNVAVLAALAVDVEQPAVAIDVGDLEAGALEQTQAAGVDGDQTGAVDRQTDAAQDPVPSSRLSTTGSFFSRGGRTRSQIAHSRRRERSQKNLIPHSAMVKLARAKRFTLVR